jgi:hypothetical protein
MLKQQKIAVEPKDVAVNNLAEASGVNAADAVPVNLALNKNASASSYLGGNTAALAFDGNGATRWESAYSDPQWISVDLGTSYSVTGVKLNWETAAGKDYKIQISIDNTNWVDAYTKTGGIGGIEDITFTAAVNGRYVRMYGTTRATVYGYSLWEFEVYSNSNTAPANLALNKNASASSYLGGNTAALAFDGNGATRWESAYSDPQWISVDLGTSYSVTGVKLNWETAAGKDYKIQISTDNTNWVDAYTETGGIGGIEDITFTAAVNGRYVRMYGTARATVYGYSLWEFEVYGAVVATNNVATPVIIPATGTYTTSQTVTITDGTSGATIRYTTDASTPTVTNGTVYSAAFVVAATTTVKAIAYKSGMANSDVATSVITIGSANSTPDFGPNVKIFDPSMLSASIQSTVDSIFTQMETNQFGNERYALLFKPGSYNVNVNVGFYSSVLGLGQMPDDVNITGSVHCEADWMQGNATCNFWRSVENLSVIPTFISNNLDPIGTLTWAVAQASPMRRVHIKGGLLLWDPFETNYDNAWSSGGFIADSKIDNTITSGSQQQFLTRNSQMGSWSGGNWNMVFVGNTGAPSDDSNYPASSDTVVAQAPVVREKPFLYIDNNGKYSVFVPAVRTNAQGVTWASGMGQGTSIPIDQFLVAQPGTSTATSLNQALSQGKNLLFTPGVYHLSEPLNITRADTVILGIGLATLTPDNGTAAMTVADVDGVKIAGILFDAGANNSPVLLQVGPNGSSANHSSNPTTLSDLFFRVGGAAVGKADVCITINSNNVIGDDFWVWRADHGAGVGWTVNTTKNGIVVNGNDVTIYGLFVEHFHEYQTLWNGNGGKVYFYQSEMPYDVPSQSAWMSENGTVNGYASYKVANTVTTHKLFGSGVYSYFRDAVVTSNTGIQAPNTAGVTIHHACSVFLNGNGEITHIVNNIGAAAKSGSTKQTVTEYP